ncbi:Putative acetyltransferase [Kitasatospora sp. MMS16-BH015]|uniref:GNAT family N-acetyltransferase n=1 Tax=Kitasatospora sp. MMS16-BH015 TaxID=2018025 RepID=UPI000CA31D60|nr:GNAT family N-acetyltransferase [Kitasatospora sp. MMS16-BH015]AUG75048.1 Putative acetyltransferase [Kitasatospora sp. MMS16-BH015]
MEIVSLGYRTDVALLQAGGSVVTDRGGHLVVRTPDNPGFHWGNFLLFAGPPWPGDALRWEVLFQDEFPAARHRAFGVDDAAGAVGSAAERAALGVRAEENVVLTATGLRAPARASAAEVRVLAGDDDWRQALELDHACYGVPEDEAGRRFAEARVAGYRALAEGGHGSWVGAFVEGHLRAGAGLFAAGRGLARYQNVETHPDFRRRGLASAVLHHAARHALPDPDGRTLVIVADPGDHAVRLYRALGFVDAERQVQLYRAG